MTEREFQKITVRLESGESLRSICKGDNAKRCEYQRIAKKKQIAKVRIAELDGNGQAASPRSVGVVSSKFSEIADPVKRLGYTLMDTTQRLLETVPDAAILRVALEILKLRDADYQSMDKKKFTPQDYYDVIKSLQAVPGEKFETYEEHQEKERQEKIKRLQEEIKRLEESYHLPEKPKEYPNGNQMPGK